MLHRVRLYLSSFRVGSNPQRLLQLLGLNRRTALIPNALDGLPSTERASGLRGDIAELDAAGLDVTLVDLRAPGSVAALADFDLVWVRGGNVFVLRRMLADSGADELLVTLLQRDAVVYGGYSAGACVLSPDLIELQRVDDIAAVSDPITTGLGLLDRPFVPHVRSPGHPETVACDSVAAAYDVRGQTHWALSDGEVLVVDGEAVEILAS
jgi:dipeptidase E